MFGLAVFTPHHRIDQEPRRRSGGPAFEALLTHLLSHPSELDLDCAECARLREAHRRQMLDDLAVPAIRP
jgi:hypothetical protein